MNMVTSCHLLRSALALVLLNSVNVVSSISLIRIDVICVSISEVHVNPQNGAKGRLTNSAGSSEQLIIPLPNLRF